MRRGKCHVGKPTYLRNFRGKPKLLLNVLLFIFVCIRIFSPWVPTRQNDVGFEGVASKGTISILALACEDSQTKNQHVYQQEEKDNKLPRGSTMYHSRDQSPVLCSRSVSRWVRSVLNEHVWPLVGNLEGFEYPVGCPWNPTNDMFGEHEKKKKFSPNLNAWECMVCGKMFKSEFYLDAHFDRQHTTVLNQSENTQGVQRTKHHLGFQSFHQSVFKNVEGPNVCLEEFCSIFDVCHRPSGSRATYTIISNPLSVHYKEMASNETDVLSGSKHRHQLEETYCDVDKLEAARLLCDHTINECFPLKSMARLLNIELKRTFCQPLDSCGIFLARRKLAGRQQQYSELTNAALKLGNTGSNMLPTWQLVAIALTILSGVMIVTMLAFCLMDGHDSYSTSNHTRRRSIISADGEEVLFRTFKESTTAFRGKRIKSTSTTQTSSSAKTPYS